MPGKPFSSLRDIFLFMTLLSAGAAALTGTRAGATDWPSWRGPSRNGVTSEKVPVWPAGGPRHVWSANVGMSYAAVAVRGGRLYAVGDRNGEETLCCLDARSGTPLWKYARKHPERV